MARDLIAAIREKQSLIAKLQAELDEAKALLLGHDQTQSSKRVRAGHVGRTAISRRTRDIAVLPYKKNSSVGKAVRILKRVGKPLHVDELAHRIRPRVKKTTLVGNLARYVKAGLVFYRSAPGEFALLEWKNREDSGQQPKRTPLRAEIAA